MSLKAIRSVLIGLKAAVLISGVVGLGFFPEIADAMPLRIDPAASSIRFTGSAFTCAPEPSGETTCTWETVSKDYTLAGSIDVQTFPWFDPTLDGRIIRITGLDLQTSAVQDGFFLNPLEGILEAGSFWANDSGCAVFDAGPPGVIACLIGFPATGVEGTFDGRRLMMTGLLADISYRFDFSIRAAIASVPEPSTLLLLLPLMAFIVRLRRPLARGA
jgi:hypothetical protein